MTKFEYLLRNIREDDTAFIQECTYSGEELLIFDEGYRTIVFAFKPLWVKSSVRFRGASIFSILERRLLYKLKKEIIAKNKNAKYDDDREELFSTYK